MSEAKKIIALTAPSGSGKTTIAREVLAAIPAMTFSVSATTRPQRENEQHGVHYYFISEDEFREQIEADGFVEYEEVYPGRFYGTLREEVERATATEPILLDIDVEGALNVKKRYGAEALTIFIRPPSLEVLAERLRNRKTETASSLRVRLDRAEHELSYAPHFDVIVVNDELAPAVDETIRLVRQFLEKDRRIEGQEDRRTGG